MLTPPTGDQRRRIWQFSGKCQIGSGSATMDPPGQKMPGRDITPAILLDLLWRTQKRTSEQSESRNGASSPCPGKTPESEWKSLLFCSISALLFQHPMLGCRNGSRYGIE
jgi:hypothetical protein